MSGIGLHEFHVLPALCGNATSGLLKHGISQIHPDDPARLTNSFLQPGEIEASSAAKIHHQVAALQLETPDRLSPKGVQPMDTALVIAFGLLLVKRNEPGVLFRHALAAPLSITRLLVTHAFPLACRFVSQRCCPSPSRTLFFLAGVHLLLRLRTSRRDKQHRLES